VVCHHRSQTSQLSRPTREPNRSPTTSTPSISPNSVRWEVVDDHHLEATYEFDDFADALAFTNEIGELAEAEGHHPDLHLSWGEVGVEMWSHDIGGLHESDFVMAARMDRIYDGDGGD